MSASTAIEREHFDVVLADSEGNGPGHLDHNL
jgi:hypothetical protein